MIKQNTIKMVVDVILWLVIVLIMKDKNIVLCITQSIFSSEILISYLKLLYFNNKVNGIYNKLFTLFITNKYSSNKEPQLLEYSFEYECLKVPVIFYYLQIILIKTTPNGRKIGN